MTAAQLLTPIEFSSLPEGRIKKVGRINLITLNGSAYDMGYQHGVIAQELYVKGLILFFARFLRVLRLGIKDMVPTEFLSKKAEKLFERYVEILSSNLKKRYTTWMIDEIKGFSDGSGESVELLKKLVAMPDILQMLLSRGLSRTRANSIAALNFGCTSVGVWGNKTYDGSFIYGRNLDFFDDHSMDSYPSVLLYKPDKGMKYAAFSFLGVFGGGITGINEAGITCALHIMLSKDVSSFSTPIMNILNEILRNAESMEDAIRIAKSFKFSSGWGIAVTDARHGKAGVIEASSRYVASRQAVSNYIINTNHYNTELLKKREYDYNVSTTASTIGRYKRAEEIIKEKNGKFNEQDMIMLLGDHLEYFTRRERALGSTIMAIHNVGSYVFKPEELKVWVAQGDAPTNHSDYIGMDIKSWMDGELRLLDIKPPHPYANSHNFNVFKEHYEQAYQKYFYHNNVKDALKEMEELTREDQTEPIYFMLKGQLYLKTSMYDKALDAFEKALTMPDIPHRIAVNLLWKARTLDILGNRQEALSLYEKVLNTGGAGTNLKKAANKGKRTMFKPSKVKQHDIDFIFSDNTGY